MDKEILELDPNILNTIFNKTSCKILVIDLHFRPLFFNENFKKANPIIVDQSLKLGEVLFSSDSQLEWKSHFEHALQGKEQVLEINYEIDGNEVFDLIKLIPFQISDKEIGGCVYIAEDETSLKNTERLLLKERKRHLDLFEDNLAGIAVTDLGLNIVKCNRAMLAIVKMNNNEITDYNLFDFYLPEDLSKTIEDIEKLKRGEIFQFSTINQYKNKLNEVILASISVRGKYNNDKFTGCVITILDISAKREVENKSIEIQEMKLKEGLSIAKQIELTRELDYRNRELYTNLILISNQNIVLKSLEKDLQKISKKADGDLKKELNKLTSKIRSQKAFGDNWKKTKIHFEAIHPDFFDKLSKRWPNLSEKDLRHCAYVRMGLTNKETAQLLNVMPKAIEMARYRIKKKIQITPSQSLFNFVNNI